MKKFINVNKLPYEVVWDLAVLGTKTKRVSKAFSKEQQKEAALTGVKPRKQLGRPGDFEYNCNLCHDALGPPGELRQHYDQVHYRAE